MQRRRIAREEEAVHGEGRPGVGVAAEHPGPRRGKRPSRLRPVPQCGPVTWRNAYLRELGRDQRVATWLDVSVMP